MLLEQMTPQLGYGINNSYELLQSKKITKATPQLSRSDSKSSVVKIYASKDEALGGISIARQSKAQEKDLTFVKSLSNDSNSTQSESKKIAKASPKLTRSDSKSSVVKIHTSKGGSHDGATMSSSNHPYTGAKEKNTVARNAQKDSNQVL